MPKLLFDANISYKIKKLLREQFPDSHHVSDLTSAVLPDSAIWQLAKEKSMVIVTYDEDFNDLQTMRGFPPKIIWLRFGNQTTVYIANKILIHAKEIHQFAESDELGILEIY